MGLIERAIAGTRIHVWYWRARYWWMDTDTGAQAHVLVFCVAVLVTIIELIKMFTTLPKPEEPVKAIYQWVVQLIIAVVMALISYALRPKIEGVQPSNQAAPTVEDGQGIHEAHGDVWIEDPFINAQRVVGQEPIKSKGKK